MRWFGLLVQPQTLTTKATGKTPVITKRIEIRYLPDKSGRQPFDILSITHELDTRESAHICRTVPCDSFESKC